MIMDDNNISIMIIVLVINNKTTMVLVNLRNILKIRRNLRNLELFPTKREKSNCLSNKECYKWIM